MATADVQQPPADAATSGVPDYLASPNAIFDDEGVQWRYGKAPDYSKTRKVWEEGERSLLCIACFSISSVSWCLVTGHDFLSSCWYRDLWERNAVSPLSDYDSDLTTHSLAMYRRGMARAHS